MELAKGGDLMEALQGHRAGFQAGVERQSLRMGKQPVTATDQSFQNATFQKGFRKIWNSRDFRLLSESKQLSKQKSKNASFLSDDRLQEEQGKELILDVARGERQRSAPFAALAQMNMFSAVSWNSNDYSPCLVPIGSSSYS